MGFGALALHHLLGNEVRADAGGSALGVNPLAPRAPHFAAKAKHVIHIFANGGPSHVDTFDPKPSILKYAGQPMPGETPRTERKTGALYPSPFKFRKYGESGIEVSELFEKTAAHIDDMCIIRSMHADVPNHEPSLLLMNCGEPRQVRPSMGSWMTMVWEPTTRTCQRLLPCARAVIPSRNPKTGKRFLARHLPGTYIDTQHESIDKLIEYITNERITTANQRRQLDLVQQLNRKHQAARDADPQLEARIQSFELAYRMQHEAAEVFDVAREPQHVLDAYGPGVHARQLLVARRMIEHGVRYVQVWHGEGQPWDNHDDIEVNHRRLAKQCDQPIAALLADLKQRGMLEETLVIWGGEFGRTPTVELPKEGSNAGKINGRDHNHWGFTMWLAGGGVRGGYVHGATDEFGFKAIENRVHVHDLHATLLQLLGFDHERFTYRWAGRDYRLTDLYGRIIKELIA